MKGRLRVLVIDHVGGIELFREKYRLLAADPDLDLTVVIPETWIENGRLVRCGASEGGYRIRTGKAGFPGYENRGFFYSGLAAAMRSARPHILHMMEEPFSFFALQSVLLARIFCPDAKIVFYTFDNLHTGFRYPYRPSWLYGMIQRIVQRRAYLGTAGCADAERVLRSRGFRKPIRYIPLAVDHEAFQKRDRTRRRREMNLGKFVIGFVGRFLPVKGIPDLFAALGDLTGDWSCLLVGDGDERDNMMNLARSSGFGDRIRIVSGVTHGEIPEFLNLMDVLVLPSRTLEGAKEQFGRVLIEAMACSVAVVGSSSGSIPEVVGDAGAIFPERDAKALARILTELQHDVGRRAEMAAAGRERVLRYFTWRRVADHYREIYRDLMKGIHESERAPLWSISS